MASRYSKYIHIQPIRKIEPAVTDIIYTMKQFETIDQIAYKFYRDATLGWVIMCANPDQYMEFFIQQGTQLRIPFPLNRVWSALGLTGEL